MSIPEAPTAAPLRIGVFDSGVGGLSVLRAIHARLPQVALHYVADTAHAPYGDRDEALIRQRAESIAGHLIDQGAQVLVIACNTATAIAIDTLRAKLAPMPIVGVEPGLRPALARSRNGRVGVMATAATLRSRRFRALLDREAAGRDVHLQACVGLADAIEGAAPASGTLPMLIERHCRPLREAGVDTVALGCTHYPLVREAIEQALGTGIEVIDTADAVAAQVQRVAGPAASTADSSGGPAPCLLQTTGDVQQLQRLAARWLSFPFAVEPAPPALITLAA